MGKTILMIHGRHFKPSKQQLKKLWVAALRHGIERDFSGKVSAFDSATVELVYYGDVSNEFLEANTRERYNAAKDVKDRSLALQDLMQLKKSQFTEKHYRKVPGASFWKEGLADIFAGPLSVLGLSDRAISHVAPDMAEYWDESTDFGSRVRAPMVRPLLKALDSGDEVCVIAHSLGSLIAYDTFWKLSHMSEYQGSIQPGINYLGKLIDCFVTIGSPLADSTVIGKLKGSRNRDQRRFPTNVRRWVNLAAEDDYISHDQTVANDFSEMVTRSVDSQGRTRFRKTKITDIRMYNLARRGLIDGGDGKNNPHHGTGYLISPAMAKTVANWL